MDNMQTDMFLENIKNIEKRVSNIERTTQPQLVDWYDMNPSAISYGGTDNTIQVNSSTPVENIFQIGDRLKVVQTTTKYFFIILVDIINNILYVNAGDNYTLNNSEITSFSLSKNPLPSDFPLSFRFTPLLYQWGFPSGYFVPTGENYIDYSMTGNTINMYLSSQSLSWPETYTIEALLPFKDTGEIRGKLYHGAGYDLLTNDTDGNHLFAMDVGRYTGGLFPVDYYWSFSSTDAAPFASGSNGLRGAVTFVL